MFFYKLRSAYSIATELLSALDLEDCFKILVNRIASYMSVETISVMFIDNKKCQLVIRIAKGLSEDIVRNTSTRIDEGIAGWVARTGEPLLIKDINKDTRFAARSGGRYYNNSLLSVPLKVRNRVIGVINVNNKISRSIFREHDLDLLKTISDFTAIAIEIIRLEEEAAKNNREYNEAISNVVHDLKAPLATIQEALLLMLEGIGGSLTEKHHKYADISMQNIKRMICMVDEMLSDRRGTKRNLFDIVGTMRTILDSFDILARKNEIVLKSAVPSKEIKIWGDPYELNEVISNLVENAIKYNKPKGRVDVALEDAGKSITISVCDTGPGIPKDDIGMIFDRYYRLNRDASANIPGTGLGLAIVKDIVNMHKGNISVESEQDKGTKFTVTLPKDLRV